MTSSLSDLSSAPTLGVGRRNQPKKQSSSFSGFDIDESLFESSSSTTKKKDSVGVSGVSEPAGGVSTTSSHSSFDALLGGTSGGNRQTKDGFNPTAAALGGMNKSKDIKKKDDFDPLADILGEDWGREAAPGNKTRGGAAPAGNSNTNTQFGTRPRGGGPMASTTPPISRTPPVEKKEPDPMEDLSIDDDQLRELMEQNAKLEQELASRYEEPEKKKETEYIAATAKEPELLLKKDPKLSGGMTASTSTESASYDFSTKNTNDAAPHGLSSSLTSQSHAHSSGAAPPFLDTLEENSEEEAAAAYTPAPRVGPGRALPAGGGISSYHVHNGALGNNPTIEEESQASTTPRTHTPPAVAAVVSSTDHGGGFGRRSITDEGSNLLREGSHEGGVGGGGGFGRRHSSVNEGSGNKQIGRKPKTQLDAKDFDSFLDEFVNAADPPKETAPPAPQGQKISDAETSEQVDAGQGPTLSEGAFTTDWSPPVRKRGVAAAVPKGRPRGGETRTSSNPKESHADLPMFEDKAAPPAESHIGATQSGASAHAPIVGNTSIGAYPVSTGATPFSSTTTNLPSSGSYHTTGHSAAPAFSSAGAGTSAHTPAQPHQQYSSSGSGGAQPPGPQSSTHNVTELRTEIGRLTGILAFMEAKAVKLQDELDQSANEKRKKVIQLEEERALDRSRWELEQKRLEAEITRLHESVLEEQRRGKELKIRQKEMIDLERQEVRRDWDQRMKDETARLRRQASQEQEHIETRHRRHVESLTDQHAREMESVRVASRSSVELVTVMDRVQDTTVQVESLARRLDGAKSNQEDSLKMQLDQRERNVAAMERHCQERLQEVEAQRRKLTHLIDSMKDDRASSEDQVQHARERVDRDHQRVLELLTTTKEKDQQSLALLDEQRAQLEDERRRFEGEKEASMSREKEIKNENEATLRRLKKERESLDALRRVVEQAEMNCGRRIQESETIVTSEKRNMMVDLEVLAERERVLKMELDALATKRHYVQVEAARVEEEGARVRLFAAEVHKRSEEICVFYEETRHAKEESQRLHNEVMDSERQIASEKANLKSLHTLVEGQRLELLKETTVRLERRENNPTFLPPQGPTPQQVQMQMHMQPNPQEMPALPPPPPTFWMPPPTPIISHEELENQLQKWSRTSEQNRERINEFENRIVECQTATPPFPSSRQVTARDRITSSLADDYNRARTDPHRANVGLRPIPIPLNDAPFEAHQPNFTLVSDDHIHMRGYCTPPPDMIPTASLRTLEPLPSEAEADESR